MKKILFIALLAFSMGAKAQITLEHIYDSSATYNWCPGAGAAQLMIINFEVSGYRYVKINRCGHLMSIYNLNHSLVKNINLSNLPISTLAWVGDIIYLSEHLFNTDSKMEFIYIYNFTDSLGNGNFVTNIYNEDINLLFTDTSAAWIKTNYIQQQYPIYNTPNGTKMILSCNNGRAKVFSLPGTLSLDIEKFNNSIIDRGYYISNAYPNPTNNATKIDYVLPQNVNEGVILFYDLQGNEIKRFVVDRTFSTLLVSTADINAGTYYYQLQTSGQSSGGKKLIVIK